MRFVQGHARIEACGPPGAEQVKRALSVGCRQQVLGSVRWALHSVRGCFDTLRIFASTSRPLGLSGLFSTTADGCSDRCCSPTPGPQFASCSSASSLTEPWPTKSTAAASIELSDAGRAAPAPREDSAAALWKVFQWRASQNTANRHFPRGLAVSGARLTTLPIRDATASDKEVPPCGFRCTRAVRAHLGGDHLTM